ncbi:hypothetical protein [Pseudomonas sp. NFX224]
MSNRLLFTTTSAWADFTASPERARSTDNNGIAVNMTSAFFQELK